MNSDSGSGFYFQNVMRNHQFFIQNEFLRENMSRPTNDISVFDSFTEEELFCANFNNIPSNNSVLISTTFHLIIVHLAFLTIQIIICITKLKIIQIVILI